jgi:hypothetical protein
MDGPEDFRGSINFQLMRMIENGKITKSEENKNDCVKSEDWPIYPILSASRQLLIVSSASYAAGLAADLIDQSGEANCDRDHP